MNFENDIKCNLTRGTSEKLTKFVVGKPEENRALGRPRLRREDNVAGTASECEVFDVCVTVHL